MACHVLHISVYEECGFVHHNRVDRCRMVFLEVGVATTGYVVFDACDPTSGCG